MPRRNDFWYCAMMADTPRPDPSLLIEQTFAAIATGAMRDVPILNPALRVEAVGFRVWEDHWLGVLVTPWTIGLMLLPKRLAAAPPPGSVRSYRFPSGSYDFLGGFHAALGGYWTCSLFSPPAEFADQDGARQVAHEVLTALFGEDDDSATRREAARLRGQAPVYSRRAFLLGGGR